VYTNDFLLLPVMDAVVQSMPRWIKLPTQAEANKNKIRFYEKGGFPNVFGCIDCTHVRIQAPVLNEHEYV